MNSIKKEIIYKRRLNDSYEIICLENGELALHELEMLRRNQIDTLLPVEFMIEDGDCQFWYQITGLQSLSTLIKTGHFGLEGLKTLISGLKKTVGYLENYLLRESAMNLNQIYFSLDGKRVYFSYCPFYETCKEETPLKDQVIEVLEKLVKDADYSNKEYVAMLFGAYEELSMENGSILNLSIEEKQEPLLLEPETEDLVDKKEDYENKPYVSIETIDESRKMEPEKTMDNFFDRMKTKISRAAVEKVKDEMWNAKKLTRRYTDFKNVRFTEPEYIEPSQIREHPTEYLGKSSKEGEYDDTKTEALLKIRGEHEKETEVMLTKERLILGKKGGYADIILKDPTVSRMHALIEKREEGYVLEDLNSLNGTYINGKLVVMKQQMTLNDSDEIRIGNTALTFHCN